MAKSKLAEAMWKKTIDKQTGTEKTAASDSAEAPKPVSAGVSEYRARIEKMRKASEKAVKSAKKELSEIPPKEFSPRSKAGIKAGLKAFAPAVKEHYDMTVEDFNMFALINEATAEPAAVEFQELMAGRLSQKFHAVLDSLRDLTAERMFSSRDEEEKVSTNAVVEALTAVGVELTEEQIESLLEYSLWKPHVVNANRKGIVQKNKKVKPPTDALRKKYNVPVATDDNAEPAKIKRRPQGVKEDVSFVDVLTSLGITLTEEQDAAMDEVLSQMLLAEALAEDFYTRIAMVAEAVGFDADTTSDFVDLILENYNDIESVDGFEPIVECLDLSEEIKEELLEALHVQVRKSRHMNKNHQAARDAEDKGDWNAAAAHWRSASKSASNPVAYKQLKARSKDAASKANRTPSVRPTVKKGIIDRVKSFFSRKKLSEEMLTLTIDTILEAYAEVDEVPSDEQLVEDIQMVAFELLNEDALLFEDEALDESSHLTKMRKERDEEDYTKKKKDREESLKKFAARRGKELKTEDVETVMMFALAEALVQEMLEEEGVEPEYLEELSKKTLASYVKKANIDVFVNGSLGGMNQMRYRRDGSDEHAQKAKAFRAHAEKRSRGIDKAVDKLAK